MNIVCPVLCQNSVTCVLTEFESFNHLVPQASEKDQTVAAAELIHRTLPDRASDFIVKVKNDIGPALRDTFHVSYK